MFISFVRAKETNQRKLAGCSSRPPTLSSIAQPKELVLTQLLELNVIANRIWLVNEFLVRTQAAFGCKRQSSPSGSRPVN